MIKNMEKYYVPATGAHESHYDSRTFRHDTTLATPTPSSGGYDYGPSDIEHQHIVGICTAISLVQNAAKAKGRKYSADFQYLLQKKYYDLNWNEGSSIFNALRVGKNYGFLPVELFTRVTEQDRYLPYTQYVAKLQAIPEAEIQRLIGLCVDKLSGYAQLSTDPDSLAKGILASKSGILCRYVVGKEWWTAKDGRVSWDTADIDPMRPAQVPVSGHAIGATKFEFSVTQNVTFANTWGIFWNDQNKGNCHIIQSDYAPSEAWIPYYDVTPVPLPKPFIFTQDMSYGQTSNDVLQLQKRLNMTSQTGYYGMETSNALYQFQLENVVLSWWEKFVVRGTRCGPKTRGVLNNLIKK